MTELKQEKKVPKLNEAFAPPDAGISKPTIFAISTNL